MAPKRDPQTPGVTTRAMRRAEAATVATATDNASSNRDSERSSRRNNTSNGDNHNSNNNSSNGNSNRGNDVDDHAGEQPFEDPTSGVNASIEPWLQNIERQAAAGRETWLENIEYQAVAGVKGLCKRPRVFLGAFIAAIWLVTDMLCSAGPICKFYPRWYLWYFYARTSLPELVAICGAYLLFILGICNAFEGAAKTIENVGKRLARHPIEMRIWAIPGDLSEYARTNLPPLALDVTNLIIEPLLLVALTISFKEFLPFGSGPERAFVTSFLLHLTKWCCQAADYTFIKRTRRPSWRPVCFAVFGAMSLVLLYQNRRVFSYGPHGEAVEAFLHSQGYHLHGNGTKINVGGWDNWEGRSVASAAFTLTRYLVTGGITPTISASAI